MSVSVQRGLPLEGRRNVRCKVRCAQGVVVGVAAYVTEASRTVSQAPSRVSITQQALSSLLCGERQPTASLQPADEHGRHTF